jgi:hypothetical protein
MKFVIAAIAALTFASCSSSEKKADEAKAAPSEAPVSHAMTSDEIAAKYSIVELNSAANLLKVIVDEAGEKPTDDKGTDLIGCALTGRQAGTMTMPLKFLIDQQLRNETESYQADPRNYAVEKSFETCASHCACGVLSDIVNAADESALPRGNSSRLHARNKQRLSLKAKHQTNRDSLACARKQSWFCSSDLKTYLEKEAKANAE